MAKTDPGKTTKPPTESREQRLAKALRANLKRRRAAPGPAPDAGPSGSPKPD